MKFLDIELTPEDQKELSQILKEWKDAELKKMTESLELLKQEEVKKIEESLVEYKEELEETYIDQVNTIIESLKPQIKKQVLTEMTDNNPNVIIMEKIKELVYPLLNESGKAYTNEISLLKKELEDVKKQNELKEGAEKKAQLLANYSPKTKILLDKMIGEGSKMQITEKFYEIIEAFQDNGNSDFVEKTETVEESFDDEEELLNVVNEDFKPTVETSSIEKEQPKKGQPKVKTFKDSIKKLYI
jgi:vacuolar-type H+-ATPase subunit B/Vma2